MFKKEVAMNATIQKDSGKGTHFLFNSHGIEVRGLLRHRRKTRMTNNHLQYFLFKLLALFVFSYIFSDKFSLSQKSDNTHNDHLICKNCNISGLYTLSLISVSHSPPRERRLEAPLADPSDLETVSTATFRFDDVASRNHISGVCMLFSNFRGMYSCASKH